MLATELIAIVAQREGMTPEQVAEAIGTVLGKVLENTSVRRGSGVLCD